VFLPLLPTAIIKFLNSGKDKKGMPNGKLLKITID
jgi:hypothetical protein